MKHQPEIPVSRPSADRSALWKSLIIGGFALTAVFVGLELARPAPPPVAAPGNAEIHVTLPPAAPEPPAAAEPVDSVTTTEVADAVVPAPATPPAAASPPAPPPSGRVLVGFDGEEPLVLTGLEAGRQKNRDRDAKLFARTIDEQAWEAYRKFLLASIAAALPAKPTSPGTNRYDDIWREPALYQALLRWQVLGKFAPADISAHVRDAYSGSLLTWLCNNPPAMEEFLLTFKPEDDAAGTLKFLMNAWDNTKDDMEKYFPLALACAVVFDREITIPHPVAGTYGEKAVVAPMPRYMWFVANNEKGLLAAPVHHSSARDLVWVVCAPVSTSELDWSLKKMHLSRKHWGNAYGMIEYLMERAVNGLDPYKEYTFAEIRKEGGICGDQSYFCTNTARAQGIPAMTFGGETDLGPHAWVGMKVAKDEWTTGIGRVGGVSKGTTWDPQTGKEITEQDVQLWGDREHQSPVTTLAVARHLWLASVFEASGNEEEQDKAVRLANQVGPSFLETWNALFSRLKARTHLTGEPAVPDNLDDWKWFASAMRREFKDNPRMAALAAQAEDEFIFPYGEEGGIDRLLMRERRRIARESGEQADLIAASLKRQAELIGNRGGPSAKQDISRLYDSALRNYGSNITGFKIMADDYFNYFRNDPELARKTARDIELAFMRVVDTGSKDWFRAQTESSIYKMICGYYRAAGDEARAIKLEKRYEVLLKHAERGAL